MTPTGGSLSSPTFAAPSVYKTTGGHLLKTFMDGGRQSCSNSISQRRAAMYACNLMLPPNWHWRVRIGAKHARPTLPKTVDATKSAFPTSRAVWLAERKLLAKTPEISADKF